MFDRTEHQAKNATKTSREESRMDDEREGDKFRSSTVPNTRRRIATKTPLEVNNCDKRTVAVTTQESLDGVREKAMRIPSLDETGASSSLRRGLSPGGAEIDKTEIVRALVGSITAQGDNVVVCDSKSKLWKDEERNAKLEHETCRRCEESMISVKSVHQQCTTGESDEDQ